MVQPSSMFEHSNLTVLLDFDSIFMSFIPHCVETCVFSVDKDNNSIDFKIITQVNLSSKLLLNLFF